MNIIKNKEIEISTAIELPHYIRLRNLERKDCLQKCYSKILALPLQPARPKTILESPYRELIIDRFEKDLQPILETEKGYLRFSDIKAFKQSIETSSLVSTVSQSLPEVGTLLHLPEMDRTLVRAFDNAIVGHCLKNLISFVIRNSELSFILEREYLFKTTEKGRNLLQAAEQLLNHINGGKGKSRIVNEPNQDLEAINQYKELEAQHQAILEAHKDKQEKYNLPKWATALLVIPLAIPFVVFKLVQATALYLSKEKTQKQLHDVATQLSDLIEKSTNQLKQDLANLQVLTEIKVFIRKQEIIDELFHGEYLFDGTPVNQKANIHDLIENISAEYKNQVEWNARVQFIAEKLERFPDINENMVLQTVAYLLNPAVTDPTKLFDHPVLDPFWHDTIQRGQKDLGLNMQIPLSRVLLGAAILEKYGVDVSN